MSGRKKFPKPVSDDVQDARVARCGDLDSWKGLIKSFQDLDLRRAYNSSQIAFFPIPDFISQFVVGNAWNWRLLSSIHIKDAGVAIRQSRGYISTLRRVQKWVGGGGHQGKTRCTHKHKKYRKPIDSERKSKNIDVVESKT